MTPPRKAVAAKATPARVRRPTAAEMAAVSPVTPGPEVWEEPPAPSFDPDVDFDMSTWRDEQQAQVVEATRETLTFRIADRRPVDKPAKGQPLARPPYEVEIPLLSKWRTKALRLLEQGSVGGIIEALAVVTGDPEIEDVLDELDADEVGAIIEHLTSRSGVTPGESRPSGASSRTTRRR